MFLSFSISRQKWCMRSPRVGNTQLRTIEKWRRRPLIFIRLYIRILYIDIAVLLYTMQLIVSKSENIRKTRAYRTCIGTFVTYEHELNVCFFLYLYSPNDDWITQYFFGCESAISLPTVCVTGQANDFATFWLCVCVFPSNDSEIVVYWHISTGRPTGNTILMPHRNHIKFHIFTIQTIICNNQFNSYITLVRSLPLPLVVRVRECVPQ